MAHIYVAQTAAGADNGSNCANAKSIAWFNTSGNWGGGAGEINAGDTVHFCGTITTAATVQGDGSSGNPITLTFESGAVFTSPVWPLTGAINIGSHAWIDIDGNGVGLIQNTDNGSPSLGFTFQDVSSGISAVGGSNINVRDITIWHIYQRAPGATDGRVDTYCVRLADTTPASVMNCAVSDCDTPITMTWPSGTSSGWVVSGNTILRCNHGINMGTSSVGGYMSNIQIVDNVINDLDTFAGSGENHLDGIILFIESPAPAYDGSVANVLIEGNTIGPNIGDGIPGQEENTAGIFIDTYQDVQVTGLKIINNIFLAADGDAWANAFVTYAHGDGAVVANNTFVHQGATARGTAFRGASINCDWKNNITSHVACGVDLGPASDWPVGLVCTNNLYFGLTAGSGSFVGPNNNLGNLAFWQANGYDLDALLTDPDLDGAYHLQSGSPAIGAGANLSSDFTTDKNGATRTVPWDLGAYVYAAPNVIGTLNVANLIVG